MSKFVLLMLLVRLKLMMTLKKEARRMSVMRRAMLLVWADDLGLGYCTAYSALSHVNISTLLHSQSGIISLVELTCLKKRELKILIFQLVYLLSMHVLYIEEYPGTSLPVSHL